MLFLPARTLRESTWNLKESTCGRCPWMKGPSPFGVMDAFENFWRKFHVHVHIASSGIPEARPSPQTGSVSSSTGLRSIRLTRAKPRAPVCAAHLLTECPMPRLSSQGQGSSVCSSASPQKRTGPVYGR